MNKLRWDLFPDIQYGEKIYQADEDKKLCPLVMIIDKLLNSKDDREGRILLVGEAAIGKTSNILSLKIELIKRGIGFYYFNLRDINRTTRNCEKKKIESLTEKAVMIFDSYDESANKDFAKELIDCATEKKPKILLIASRDSKEMLEGFFSEWSRAMLQPLRDSQIKKVLEKFNVSADDGIYSLLHNTMLLSLYLQIKSSKCCSDGPLENETDILREYFNTLFKEKDYCTDNCAHVLSAIGQIFLDKRIFDDQEKNIIKMSIVAPINDIFTVEKACYDSGFVSSLSEDNPLKTLVDYVQINGFMLRSIHKQFNNYVVAVYLEQCIKRSIKNGQTSKELYEIFFPGEYDQFQVLYYLGQMLDKSEIEVFCEALSKHNEQVENSYSPENVHGLKERVIIELIVLFGYRTGELLYGGSLWPKFSFWNEWCTSEYYEFLAEGYEFIANKIKLLNDGFPLLECLSWGFSFPLAEEINYSDDKHISKGNCLLEKLDGNGYSLILGCKNSKIPEDACFIEKKAFYGCSELKNISIPPTINSIGESAFSFCSKLKTLTIESSDISREEPLRLTEFSFANFGASVEKLIINREISLDQRLRVGKVFKGFSNLKSLSITTQLLSLGCLDIKEISENVEELHLCKCNIFASVTEERPIKWFKNLKIISFSADIEEIDYNAIYACENLEHIVVDKGNKKYVSINDCLIDREESVIIRGCKNSVIPKDYQIKHICRYAFYRCKELKSIEVPEGVTSIGAYAFGQCDSLETIYLPSTLKNVEGWVFADCPKLKSVFIPKECKGTDYVLLKGNYWYRDKIKFI